jgi:putative membrane protein
MSVPDRYNLTLLIVFLAFWLLLALSPTDRPTWLLENMLVFLWVPVLVWGYWHLRLSRLSYTLITVFFCLHAVGAHFTYSLVPYDRVWQDLFGFSLNEALGFGRNHYDRFLHFLFGALLAYPCRELFIRVAGARGFWGYFLPLLLMMSLSTLYELIEWGAAVVFGGDLGVHYLGTQGDEWDGQRDMALASLGAVLAMLVTLAVNVSLQRDFAREWQESLEVKARQPLGEEAVARMLHERESRDQSE